MGLRFRRRVTIFPGFHLNVSKSGIGASVGPRGAKIGLGPRGVHGSLGLPGSGLHFRKDKSWGALKREMGESGARASGGNRGITSIDAILRLRDSGQVEFVSEDGTPLPPRFIRALRANLSHEIDAFLSEAIEARNGDIDRILSIHLDTPDPKAELALAPNPFDAPRPQPVPPLETGLAARIWRSKRERLERAHEAALQAHASEVKAWEDARAEHEAAQAALRAAFEGARGVTHLDLDAMEALFAQRIEALHWPRETHVSFQLNQEGRALALDVDLPEVEAMPTETATRAARGVSLRIQQKSETQVRREYKRHVHGVLFRLMGEAFFALPRLEIVTASGYSQRPDPSTGHLRDEYLVSARATRPAWSALNFSNLGALNVDAAFEGFELRRSMTRTGIFRAIIPFEEGDPT